MRNIKLDLAKAGGKIKYMNGVNNGPTAPNVRKTPTNFDLYKEAETSLLWPPYVKSQLIGKHPDAGKD